MCIDCCVRGHAGVLSLYNQLGEVVGVMQGTKRGLGL